MPATVWHAGRNEHFAVLNGNLHCNACSETLSLKKSSIGKHIKSSKHIKGISRVVRDKESQSIMECLQRFDKKENASGSTLLEEVRLLWFEVVEGLLSGAFLCQMLTFFTRYLRGMVTD